MPDQREAAARSVAEIIGAIDLLDAKERERLYLRLLMSRAGSPALSSALASPSGPPTASGHAATALPNPVSVDGIRATEEPVLDARSWAKGKHLRTAVQSTITIDLYDLAGLLPPLGTSFSTRLESHLANVDKWTDRLPGQLASNQISFKVRIASSVPSARQRRDMSSLAFPVYFIDESRMQTLQLVLGIMDEHAVPTVVPGTGRRPIRDKVREDWASGIRGVTVPPGTLGRGRKLPRCTFMKGKRIAQEANGDPTYYANMVAHEFGHACNLFGGGAHPADGSVMEPQKAVAQMKAELYPFNKAHSTLIVSFLISLARLALVASIAFVLGCRPSHIVTGGQCIPAPALDISCAGCEVPARLEPRQEQALAVSVLRGVVAQEVEKGVLTDGTGQGVSLRYFLVPAGLRAALASTTQTVASVSELDAIAREQPHRHVYFIELEPISFAADDRVYLRVRTTNHMWLGDRFFDEETDGTYCVRRVGAAVDLFVVEPPLFLRD